MAATIVDVARESGLAISTISKYINGGKVREKNRVRIEEAIRKLNYSPKTSARSLRSSKSYLVGLITGMIEGPHSAELLRYIEERLTDSGYSLIYGTASENNSVSDKFIDYLMDTHVDGVLAVPIGNFRHQLNKIQECHIPVVLLEDNIPSIEADCVQTDSALGMQRLVEYMILKGHRKIAILNGQQDRMTAVERYRGYCRALEDYMIPIDSRYVVPGTYSFESGASGLHRLWEMNPEERPTAVVSASYDISEGMMSAVSELGIRVPEELSIGVFDDFELSQMVRPKLTSVQQPLGKVASAACNLLLKRIQGEALSCRQIIRIPPTLNERASVKNLNV